MGGTPINVALRALCVLPASFPCPVASSPQNFVALPAQLCPALPDSSCLSGRAEPPGWFPVPRGHQKVARGNDPQHTACPDMAALVTLGWGQQLAGSGGARGVRDARPGCSARCWSWVLPRFLPSSVAEGARTSWVSEAVPAHAEPHPAAAVCRGSRCLCTPTPALCVGPSLT